jgi:hypothetical protein
MSNVVVRLAMPGDLPDLRSAMVELQEHERRLAATRLPGEQIADPYPPRLQRRLPRNAAPSWWSRATAYSPVSPPAGSSSATISRRSGTRTASAISPISASRGRSDFSRHSLPHNSRG